MGSCRAVGRSRLSIDGGDIVNIEKIARSRIEVVPIRDVDGRIQEWAVNSAGYEMAFYEDRLAALNFGNQVARARGCP